MTITWPLDSCVIPPRPVATIGATITAMTVSVDDVVKDIGVAVEAVVGIIIAVVAVAVTLPALHRPAIR